MNQISDTTLLKPSEISESGFYMVLCRGSKMVNHAGWIGAEWEVVYVEVVPDQQFKMHNTRKLTPGKWVCGIGKVQWYRLESIIGMVAYKKLEFPPVDKNMFI